MREIADRMRQKYGSAVVAIGSARRRQGRDPGRGHARPDSRIKAGDIVKHIAPIVGGTGGGRPDLAQAGGRDASGSTKRWNASPRWSRKYLVTSLSIARLICAHLICASQVRALKVSAKSATILGNAAVELATDFSTPRIDPTRLSNTISQPATEDSLELHFDDHRSFTDLLGQHDAHVHVIEQALGVRIGVNGSTLAHLGRP